MPTVFSSGWLYLFLIVMAVCLARIFVKLRTIQREAPMDRPVIRVEPLPRKEEALGEDMEGDPLFQETDRLIREGDYAGAATSLDGLLETLSPVEDREARGKALYRRGACFRRMVAAGPAPKNLLRSGESLREAVRLFAPSRYRLLYLRSLEELAGLYGDLAALGNPVEHLTQVARTSQTAAASAEQGGLFQDQARFLVMAAGAYRLLAREGDSQANLRLSVESYERAVEALSRWGGEAAALEKARVLRKTGDTFTELAAYFQKPESLGRAAESYDAALELLKAEQHPGERGALLKDLGRVELEIYGLERSPAPLRKALRCLRDAIESLKGGGEEVARALAMALMGDALTEYSRVKDREENLRRAARLYEAALGILKDGVEPAERERVKGRLAEVVKKISENR